jgi:hypothetical protein
MRVLIVIMGGVDWMLRERQCATQGKFGSGSSQRSHGRDGGHHWAWNWDAAVLSYDSRSPNADNHNTLRGRFHTTKSLSRHVRSSRRSSFVYASGKLILSGRSVLSVRSRTSFNDAWRINGSCVQLVISIPAISSGLAQFRPVQWGPASYPYRGPAKARERKKFGGLIGSRKEPYWPNRVGSFGLGRERHGGLSRSD